MVNPGENIREALRTVESDHAAHAAGFVPWDRSGEWFYRFACVWDVLAVGSRLAGVLS